MGNCVNESTSNLRYTTFKVKLHSIRLHGSFGHVPGIWMNRIQLINVYVYTVLSPYNIRIVKIRKHKKIVNNISAKRLLCFLNVPVRIGGYKPLCRVHKCRLLLKFSFERKKNTINPNKRIRFLTGQTRAFAVAGARRFSFYVNFCSVCFVFSHYGTTPYKSPLATYGI